MKPSCTKKRVDILDYFAISNITFDDNVVQDFYIIRQQTHYCILYFTQQVYKEILEQEAKYFEIAKDRIQQAS